MVRCICLKFDFIVRCSIYCLLCVSRVYHDKCVCQATIMFAYMWVTHFILSGRVIITAAMTCKTQQRGESMSQKHNAQREKTTERPPHAGHFVDSAVTFHASSASSTCVKKGSVGWEGARWQRETGSRNSLCFNIYDR